MIIDGESLNLDSIYNVCFLGEKVEISKSALDKIRSGRESIQRIMDSGRSVYGVNTGYGSLLNVKISREDTEKLQLNLIRSHSAGSGRPLSREKVRAMMLVRANSLCRGYSGVSLDLVKKILEFLNLDICPFVPEYGSVGASGDLAPLAHLCLSLIGEGEIMVDGKRKDAGEILVSKGISPYRLKEKEAISFINGTSAITAIASVELIRAKWNLSMAGLSFMPVFEALNGTSKAFSPWALETRKQPGQSLIGGRMHAIMESSQRVQEQNRIKVQDAYTLRCTPQVYGAVYDTIKYVESVIVAEMNSTTDNPLVNGEEYISCGNFHGEPVALVSDFLAIALTDLGNMIERRLARLTDTTLSGLDPFLVKNSGLNSGYMIGQYAAAALCNRNKILVYPGSADTIPTCANQEDHVSMGANSALKLEEINSNIKRIIATEFVMGIQAMDLSPNGYSRLSAELHDIIRKKIDFLQEDRAIYRDFEKMELLMDTDKLKEIASGSLNFWN